VRTIVLIHGFWVTPRSWEHWVRHYEDRGFHVLAPAYPGFEAEVEALNADPAPIEAVTVEQIVEHLARAVDELDEPPILIGHAAGGEFVQRLLERGHGAAGVAINSAPTAAVADRDRAVAFTHAQWRSAFTRTLDETVSRALYERYHVPAPPAIRWDGDRLEHRRAPLLFISGSDGPHLLPAAPGWEALADYVLGWAVANVRETLA